MNLAVIILNYKNVQDTLDCLSSVQKSQGVHCHVFIVDNGSNDGSLEKLQRMITNDATLIDATKNGGYAKGNNQGLRAALNLDYEYFCILNNDVLVYPTTLVKLTEYIITHPKVGVVGPGICTFEDNNLLESAGSMVNMNSGKIERLYTGMNSQSIKGLEISCDYVGGACMVFRRELLEKVGFLPEEYFLFFEENEWCYKIRQIGYSIVCYGETLVIHKGSATINKFNGLSEYYTYRNMVLFIRRNGTLKNKLIFYPYICLFVLKSGLTKEKGWHYFRYIRDGFLERDTFQIRGDN